MSGRDGSMGRLAEREREKSQEEDQQDQGQEEDQESSTSPEPSSTPSEPADPQPSDSEPTASEPTPEESDSPQEINVKDREKTLFMYLPDDLHNQVDIACQSVNLEYKMQTGDNLGKNRYLYPIVLMAGVDGAMDLEFEEIQDLVDEIDSIEDAI